MDPAYLLIPAAVVLFFCGITFLLAYVGGWRRLAAHFAAPEGLTGERFRFQSAQFGSCTNYNACLTLIRSAEGLGLSIQWPFRCGHPPILIPWSELHLVTTQRRFGMGHRVKVEVGAPPLLRLDLPKRALEGFGPFAGQGSETEAG